LFLSNCLAAKYVPIAVTKLGGRLRGDDSRRAVGAVVLEADGGGRWRATHVQCARCMCEWVQSASAGLVSVLSFYGENTRNFHFTKASTSCSTSCTYITNFTPAAT